jgi:hypothetical protein
MINNSRVHILGRSMGGTGSLEYTMHNENVIASMCDIHGVSNFTKFYYQTVPPCYYQASLRNCLGGTPEQSPLRYANNSAMSNIYHFRNKAVYIIHGTADEQINISQARDLYQNLSARGYTVRYDEVPGGPHNPPWIVWGREQTIYNWFWDHPMNFGGPQVLLNSPTGGYWSIEYPALITFNATASVTDGTLVNMSLYITDANNTNFHLYQTTLVGGMSNTTTWSVTLGQGTYTWNVIAYDNKSKYGWGVNRTLLLEDDTIPPTWVAVPSNQTPW